jgi:hypothetical protein
MQVAVFFDERLLMNIFAGVIYRNYLNVHLASPSGTSYVLYSVHGMSCMKSEMGRCDDTSFMNFSLPT